MMLKIKGSKEKSKIEIEKLEGNIAPCHLRQLD